MKKVRFLDLSISNTTEKEELLSCIQNVLEHGQLVMGPEMVELETAIAKFCNRKYAVAVGSGTDALYLGLRALNIGPGDEIITTSLSWIATANAIALTGATPVFADILDDLNIDSKSIASLVTKKTKGVLVVNYTGKICAMDAIQKICSENNIYLIEDGSQSFGANYKGKPCGSFGILSAISHNPMKVFAALGEAGSILTDDQEVYDRLISLRYNGTVNKEVCIMHGLNARMDTINAAVLLYRLQNLSALLLKRRENADFYLKELDGFVTLPIEQEYEQDVHYCFIIRSLRRNELQTHLEKYGIETKIQHPFLMPDQPAFKKNVRGQYPNAKKIVNEILSIPIHEKLTKEQLKYVVDTIKEFGISLVH